MSFEGAKRAHLARFLGLGKGYRGEVAILFSPGSKLGKANAVPRWSFIVPLGAGPRRVPHTNPLPQPLGARHPEIYQMLGSVFLTPSIAGCIRIGSVSGSSGTHKITC